LTFFKRKILTFAIERWGKGPSKTAKGEEDGNFIWDNGKLLKIHSYKCFKNTVGKASYCSECKKLVKRIRDIQQRFEKNENSIFKIPLKSLNLSNHAEILINQQKNEIQKLKNKIRALKEKLQNIKCNTNAQLQSNLLLVSNL
jgi:tRNA nucleotidyltransferase/poly(A) polymerase